MPHSIIAATDVSAPPCRVKITTEGTTLVWNLDILEKLKEMFIRISLEQKKINVKFSDLTDKINEVVEFVNDIEHGISVANKRSVETEALVRVMEKKLNSETP